MEKSKRKSLSLKEKLEIIDQIERGGRQSQISNERDLAKSTVYTIWMTRDKIRAANSIKGRQNGCKRLRQPFYEEVDQALYRWCLYAQEKDERNLSRPILTAKANKFASALGFENFKCSAGWLDRFKQRHGIRCRSKSQPDISDNEVDVKHSWFVNDLPSLLQNKSPSDIYTVNEVGLFYKVLPQESQILGENECIGSGKKITTLLGANMDGSDRLPPLVIGNSTDLTLSNLQNTDPLSVSYCQDSNSWMTAQIWAEWIRLFDDRMHSKRRKVILFIDACPSHFVVTNLRSVDIQFVPVTCKHFMPMKQGIMQRFKVWYRKLVLRDMFDSLNDGLEFHIDILSALHFIRKAWGHISQDFIINSFKLAGWSHVDCQNIEESVVPGLPPISQECSNLNVSESIFEHINQVEESMITREELTDKIILELIAAQSDVSIYIDNDEDDSACQRITSTDSPSLLNSVNENDNTTMRTTTSNDLTEKESEPGISEAKVAIETLQSFINAVEKKEKSASEASAKVAKSRTKRKSKAKVLSLCPEKGVFEIQTMKLTT